MVRGVSSSVDFYIDNLYKKDLTRFAYIRASAVSKEDIQISPQEGKIISTLLSLQKAKIVVEIGTFVGYSTAWIGSVLPADGRLVSFEINKNNFERAQQNISKLSFASKIELVNASVEDQLHAFIDAGEVDAFFIDAKKTDYITYFELSRPYLRKGGLLIADNTITSKNISNQDDIIDKMPEGIRLFNTKIANCSEFISTIIKTSSALTIAIKK